MEDELKAVINDIGDEESQEPTDDAVELEVDESGNVNTETTKKESYENYEDVPLFVKIDRYESLLSVVDEIKHFSNRINEITVLIRDIENLRRKAEDVLAKTRDELNKRIEEIDSMLIRPKNFTRKSYEAREIEDTISELRKEIEELRKSLGE